MTKAKLSAEAKGALFAITAAGLNGTVGIFSKFLLSEGMASESIAFLKTLIGFSCLLLVIPFRVRPVAVYWRSATCAFFGIFMMFYFETRAYEHELAANVVLTLMASGAVSTFVFSRILFNERSGPMRWLGLAICLAGLAIFLGATRPAHIEGLIFAAIAGISYGVFSVLSKALNLGSGFAVTRSLLFFGGACLAVPFAMQGGAIPQFSAGLGACLLALALLPSIGGFYCTTRAIELSTPTQIQLMELTEPLFATLLAAVLLSERPQVTTYLGGALVLGGLLLAQQAWKKREISSA